jgi:CheY-like chemotaxis protein/anti-sigma regulatory factor (Ser/Thr protein kinase)
VVTVVVAIAYPRIGLVTIATSKGGSSSTMTNLTDVDRSVNDAAMQRLVVIDDDSDLRRLVRLGLHGHASIEVVGEAGNGREAIEACAALPDVIMLDLGLPDITGRELLTELRQVAPDARIVVFTGQAEPTRSEVLGWGAADLVRKDQKIPALVRALETAVVDATTATCELPCTTRSAAAARRFVEATLHRWGWFDQLDDAVLVVSELVSNAVLHAGTPCTLTLRLSTNVLRVEVADGGGGSPELRTQPLSEPGGQGLRIVSALSSAWGIDPAPPGKSVWAELTAPAG